MSLLTANSDLITALSDDSLVRKNDDHADYSK